MEWKWTKGEPYERSRRIIEKKDTTAEIEDQRFSKEVEKSAYTSSLNYDENTWEILNQDVAANGFQNSSKREDLDTKISDRQLVQQRGYNPFLTQNNYADDVAIRDQFLKPVNTTQDRVKTSNE
jgi:SOS response regulatory protein OraA/RecX